MSEGKFSGGRCLRYGYRLDKEGYIRVDEEQARNVIQMFDMYINQNMSALAIYRHMNERGVLPDYSNRGSGSLKVIRILKDMTYAGKSDRGNQYPPIVTQDMVTKAREKAKQSISMPKTITKNIYYCKGIIYCKHCGHVMVACSNNCIYRCSQFGHALSVNINVLDFIAWHLTKRYAPANIIAETKVKRKEYMRLMKEENAIVDSLSQKIRQLDKKYDRLTELYIDNRITKQYFDEKVESIEQERMKIKDSIVGHTNRLITLGGLLEAISTTSVNLESVTDDNIRRKHILDSISRIEVEKIPSDSYRSDYVIHVEMKIPVIGRDYFDYRNEGKYVRLIHHHIESSLHTTEDLSLKWEHRIVRG